MTDTGAINTCKKTGTVQNQNSKPKLCLVHFLSKKFVKQLTIVLLNPAIVLLKPAHVNYKKLSFNSHFTEATIQLYQSCLRFRFNFSMNLKVYCWITVPISSSLRWFAGKLKVTTRLYIGRERRKQRGKKRKTKDRSGGCMDNRWLWVSHNQNKHSILVFFCFKMKYAFTWNEIWEKVNRKYQKYIWGHLCLFSYFNNSIVLNNDQTG